MKRFSLTIVTIAVCVGWVVGQSPAEMRVTVGFLRGLQVADGGFLPGPAGPSGGPAVHSSLRATSAALRALKHMKGSPRNGDACARFVTACFDPASGAFSDH